MGQSTTRVFLTTTILVPTLCSVGCEDASQAYCDSRYRDIAAPSLQPLKAFFLSLHSE